MASIRTGRSCVIACLAAGLVGVVGIAGVSFADIVVLDQPAEIEPGAAAVRVRPPPPPPPTVPTSNQVALDAMFTAINGVRAAARLAPYQWNASVNLAAQRHSDDMAANRQMSHTGSDGSDGGQRLTQAGFPWSMWGENIAAGFTDPVAVVQAWMASTNHRRQLLGNFQYIGVGIGVSSDGTLYWTLDLAR